jgi:hypothetical protein
MFFFIFYCETDETGNQTGYASSPTGAYRLTFGGKADGNSASVFLPLSTV